MYELLAFLSGVILAVMIQINGGLSGQFGVYHASLYVHIVGSAFAVLLLLLRRQRLSGAKGLPVCLLLAVMIPEQAVPQPFRLWIWFGGVLGVLVVVICNITVPKLPACQLTLFTLCGQLFCSIILDVLLGGMLNPREFGAGLLVAAGIVSNQLLKLYRQKKGRS